MDLDPVLTSILSQAGMRFQGGDHARWAKKGERR